MSAHEANRGLRDGQGHGAYFSCDKRHVIRESNKQTSQCGSAVTSDLTGRRGTASEGLSGKAQHPPQSQVPAEDEAESQASLWP